MNKDDKAKPPLDASVFCGEPKNKDQTLSDYLDKLICGECHLRCTLLYPNCVKGMAQAGIEEKEYRETYGD